jgi:putative glycosyltransferase (TIGR04372 family)
MWERKLNICQAVSFLYTANRTLPGGKYHTVPMHSNCHQDKDRLLELSPPHLGFNDEEEKMGQEALRNIGIRRDDKFICFHARDSAYLSQTVHSQDWSYHDYRDSDIRNYVSACEELTKKGYYAIRVGAIVKDAIESNNRRIIDYANKYRTDFMDIYLAAKCSFMIVSHTGPNALAWIFRRPIAFVNVAPFYALGQGRPCDIFIPKKYWLIKEKRFMTFKEIILSGAGAFNKSEQFQDSGIELIENSPEEIRSLAIEMDSRVDGEWQATDEDEDLQERFKKLLDLNIVTSESVGDPRKTPMRIGARFLREHAELLR